MGAGEDTRGWRRVGVLRPLEIRDFRLLWSGLTISLIGDGIFFVALPWQVLELSNSPTASGSSVPCRWSCFCCSAA